MGFRKLLRRQVVVWAIVCTVFFTFAIESISEITDKRPKADATHYVRMGYNLSNYGVISLDESDAPNPAPTSYREPGFPAYLALVMTLHPKLREANLSELSASGEEAKILKYSLFFIVAITGGLTAYIVFEITRNKVLACLALFLVSFSDSLLDTANTLYAEDLASLLVLSVAIALYKIFEQKRLVSFAFLGIALGFLVLVRAIFLYFIVFVVALFIFAFFKKNFSKNFFASLCTFLFLYSLITGAWMIRNYIHFNEFTITGRSGVVLLIRAEYNKMNVKEYFGSFLVWTPGEITEKLIDRFFGDNALELGGELERLNRDLDPQSFYRSARAQRKSLVKLYGEDRENAAINNELESVAKRRILTHPFKHILVSIPLAWRGIFVESGFYLLDPSELSVVMSLVYFVSFCMVAIASIVQRRWSLFAFIFPALFLFSMHSLFTNSNPRHNEPLIPILVVCFLVVIHLLVNGRKCEKADKPTSNADSALPSYRL